MASSVTSCISSAVCSHKQVSWLLVAALIPFFLPFLIVAVPLLLLFLAPVSWMLVFLLLLYKVLVWSKRILFGRYALKGVLDEEIPTFQQNEAADRRVSQQQELTEEEGRRYGVEGTTALEENGEESIHGYSLEEEQTGEMHDIMEGPAIEECVEGRPHGYPPREEESNVHDTQNGESSSSSSERVQEGVGAPRSHSPERERKEEKEMTEEGLKDEHKQFPACIDISPPSSPEEGQDSMRSSLTEPMKETRELPSKEIVGASLQAETADIVPSHILEKPFTDLQIPEEHLQEEAESSSGKVIPDQKEGGLYQAESMERPELEEYLQEEAERSSGKGMLDQKEGGFSPAESTERSEWRKEATMAEDLRASGDEPAKDLSVSNEAVPVVDEEEGPLPEESSFAGSPPHAVIHEGSEFQDRIQEEQKIMADIDAIRKIVGYEGEPHASIIDQIRALYLFLGMEPYYWAVEVDDFDKALAEIELLKVVVGVK